MTLSYAALSSARSLQLAQRTYDSMSDPSFNLPDHPEDNRGVIAPNVPPSDDRAEYLIAENDGLAFVAWGKPHCQPELMSVRCVFTGLCFELKASDIASLVQAAVRCGYLLSGEVVE